MLLGFGVVYVAHSGEMNKHAFNRIKRSGISNVPSKYIDTFSPGYIKRPYLKSVHMEE